MIDGIYFSEYILQLEEKLVTSSKSLLFFILSKKETRFKEKAKLTFLDFFDSLISKYLIFKRVTFALVLELPFDIYFRHTSSIKIYQLTMFQKQTFLSRDINCF